MQKIYERIDWSDDTPINEDNLDKMDYAIDLLDDRVIRLARYEERAADSAENASVSESNSKTSATNAKTSEINAKASETNAKNSEAKAKQYAEQAMSATPEGYANHVALTEQTLGYTKKNLVPYPYYETTHTEDGITWTDNGDGTLIANGTNDTSSGSEFLLFSNTERILEAGDYIINGIPDGASNDTYHIFLNYYINGTYSKSIKFKAETEFTLSEDDIETYTFLLGVRVMDGMTVNNLTFKPMIRRAEIADDTWEPYAPSVRTEIDDLKSDTTLAEQTLGYECKNLLTYPYARMKELGGSATNAGVTVTDNGNGSITVSGASTASSYSSLGIADFKLEKGVSYIFTEPSSNENTYAGLQGYKNGAWVKDIAIKTSKKEFTIDDSIDTVRLMVRRTTADSGNNVTLYPMIRRAEILDDTWEPYRPHIANDLALIKQTLGYECKNLIRYPFYMGAGEYSGITVVDNGDGTLTLNGTNTSNTYVAIHLKAYNILPLLSDMDKTKKYILSGCPSGGSKDTYYLTMAFRTSDNISVSPRLYDIGSGVVIDMNKYLTASKCQIVIWIESGITVSNLTFKPMLRPIEITDDTFEPYVPSIRDEIDDLKKNKYGMEQTEVTIMMVVSLHHSKRSIDF